MPTTETLIAIAMVGCAHIHTPQFVDMLKTRTDRVEVRAVYDHDLERAKKNAIELKSTATANLQPIWSDPEIKAVVICSETNRHEELVVAAARAGKHIFAEKPLGMGARDASVMADAVEKAGVMFQTGFFQRSIQRNRFLRDCVTSGVFGKITRVRHSNCHSGALGGWFDKEWRWMTDLEQSGVGAFGDLGAHSIDLLSWMLNDEVISATGVLGAGIGKYPPADELGEAVLKFRGGTIGTVAASWVDVADRVTLQINGTEGQAVVMDDRLYLNTPKIEGADGRKAWSKFPPPEPHPFEAFLDAVAGQPSAPLITAREAAYESAVMERIYEGAKEGRWVEVEAKRR